MQGTGGNLEHLDPLPKLKKLTINCNTLLHLSVNDILTILKSAPNLQVLVLKHSTVFQDYNKESFLEKVKSFEPKSFPKVRWFQYVFGQFITKIYFSAEEVLQLRHWSQRESGVLGTVQVHYKAISSIGILVGGTCDV